MNNFDDLFEAQAEDAPEERPFDKDSWVEKKQAERQAVYELADKTTSEVSADGGQYKLFLDVKSRLIHYSATNVLLVMAQRPLATQLRDFNGWRKAFLSSAERITSRFWRLATTTSVTMGASEPAGM